MADQPSLGYGKTGTTDLNTFNQWFRSRPEYYAKLAEFGQDPNNVHLNDDQKQQMVRLAQSLGAVINEGGDGQEVDSSGNFQNKSHKLRTGLIIAGIAAAALATAGAAGAFGGAALGAGEGAAGAAGATGAGLGGVEAGVASGLGAAALPGAGTALGGAGLAGAGAAGAAGLGGVEAGAASGLGAAALPGAETGLEASMLGAGGAGATGAGLGGVEAGAASGVADGLPGAGTALGGVGDSAGAFDAAGNFIGDSSVTGEVGDAAAAGGLGTGLGSTLGKLGALAGGVGSAIGKASTAAGNNALDQEQLGLQANGQNVVGNNAFENQLMARAKEDDSQRSTALKNAYRASYANNPRVSPFDPVGAPKYSADYLSTLGALSDQAKAKLSTASPYDTNAMPALKPYKDINPADVQGATNTKPGTLQTMGNWLSPALTTAQLIAQMWGNQ